MVVGNIAGGKTRLSRKLAHLHGLPLTHVDQLQFLPGMKIRPLPETRKTLLEITAQEAWLIDGYGPLDLLEKRFQAADRVVFIDFPLWRHLWWLSKRQGAALLGFSRRELPEGCSERSWAHTRKLYQTLWRMHRQMRPELLRIFAREPLKHKMVFIRDLRAWKKLSQEGLPAGPGIAPEKAHGFKCF